MICKALLTLEWAGLSGRVRSQTFAYRRGDLAHTEWSPTMMACPPTHRRLAVGGARFGVQHSV
jgi:hypothetical protein